MSIAAGALALAALGGGSAPARGQGFGPPTVATGPADRLHLHSARLAGALDPDGLATSYRFEYGRTEAYGFATPAVTVGAGAATVPVSAEVSGLARGTTYHYRLVASNSLGTAFGADASFSTRDPRVGGRYRVRLRIAGGGRPFRQRPGDVVHRAYTFHPRCQGPVCPAVRLVRDGQRGRFDSILRRVRSGVYAGIERFHGGRCDDGLRFHTSSPIRIAVKRTSGDHASRLRGHLEIRLRGCASGIERVRMRGRPRS